MEPPLLLIPGYAVSTLNVASTVDSGPLELGETKELPGMANRIKQYYDQEAIVEGVFLDPPDNGSEVQPDAQAEASDAAAQPGQLAPVDADAFGEDGSC